MSSPILDGLQFPIQEQNNKPSTSKTEREIIAEALSTVNPSLAQQAIKEKNWRKTYHQYFKALVESGIKTINDPIKIAELGLNKAHQSFEFYRDGQKHCFANIMQFANHSLHKIYGHEKENIEKVGSPSQRGRRTSSRTNHLTSSLKKHVFYN